MIQCYLSFFIRICILMAEQSIALRDSHQAITHYQEALKYSQDDIKVITPLARLYLQVNNVVDCKAMCTRILKLDPNNEAASVMMADISFRGVIIQFHFNFVSINTNRIELIDTHAYFQFTDELRKCCIPFFTTADWTAHLLDGISSPYRSTTKVRSNKKKLL